MKTVENRATEAAVAAAEATPMATPAAIAAIAAASAASEAEAPTTGEEEGTAPAKKKKGKPRGGKRLTGNQRSRKWRAQDKEK